MCGLCGIIYCGERIPNRIIEYQLKNSFIDMFKACAIRGSDASGIVVLNEDKIYTYKNYVRSNKLVEDEEVKKIFDTIQIGTRTKAILGHTRAQTKGPFINNFNNHPIIASDVIGIHNGVISNDDVLFETNTQLKRNGQVDSEIIFRLIDEYLKMGKSLIESVKFTVPRLIGSMACAFIYRKNPRYVVLFRDNSYTPLVMRIYKKENVITFASTAQILGVIENYGRFANNRSSEITLKNEIVRIDVLTGKIFKTNLIG